MFLFLANYQAELYKIEYEGKYKFYKEVDGAEVYYLTDKTLQAQMDAYSTVAFAIGEYICFRDRKSINKRILAHEMTHVHQARTVFAFPIRYWVYETWYETNPYEEEAEVAELLV